MCLPLTLGLPFILCLSTFLYGSNSHSVYLSFCDYPLSLCLPFIPHDLSFCVSLLFCFPFILSLLFILCPVSLCACLLLCLPFIPHDLSFCVSLLFCFPFILSLLFILCPVSLCACLLLCLPFITNFVFFHCVCLLLCLPFINHFVFFHCVCLLLCLPFINHFVFFCSVSAFCSVCLSLIILSSFALCLPFALSAFH